MYTYSLVMSGGVSPYADTAPDSTNLHDLVASHLNHVKCTDQQLEMVVRKHVSNAHAHHSIVRTLTECLCATRSGRFCVGRILKCLDMCSSRDAPPPVFIVQFKDQLIQKWATDIIHKLRSSGGRQWDLHKRSLLATSLSRMLDRGLCHMNHVTLVDQGRNPSWLADYIRCICLIWKDNAGRVTPATIQYLRKLSCCTSECVVLISEYAQLCLNGRKALELFRELSSLQRVVFSSSGSTGISNHAAEACIRSIKIDAAMFEFMESVESVLLKVWDNIINHSLDDSTCIVLPGLNGSHAYEFEIPEAVALHGSPLAVINSICSSLPLTKIDATIDHEVYMSSTLYAQTLAKGLVDHLDIMLSSKCFGGESACDPQWWTTYLDITKQIQNYVCTSLGVRPNTEPAARDSVPHDFLSTDYVNEMVVERASMLQSSIRKVQIAGNAFDVAHSEALKYTPCIMSLKRLSRVWDATSQKFIDDMSVGGRFLADFSRIVTYRTLCDEIRVDPREKTIKYMSQAATLKAMSILIEYMTEYNKSRRMRRNTNILKVNSRPEVDNRKSTKRLRATSPASPSCC